MRISYLATGRDLVLHQRVCQSNGNGVDNACKKSLTLEASTVHARVQKKELHVCVTLFETGQQGKNKSFPPGTLQGSSIPHFEFGERGGGAQRRKASRYAASNA